MNADALQFMLDKGLTLADAVELARIVESNKPKNSGAERQARYRARKALCNECNVTSDVTSDVTVGAFPAPPNENNLTPPTHTPVYKSRAREAFPILDCAEPQVWADFLKNRKAKKLPCTETAHRKLERDLERWALETGWPPGKVFETCVGKGWGAIYDPRDKANGNANRSNSSKASYAKPIDGFTAACREVANRASPEPFGESRDGINGSGLSRIARLGYDSAYEGRTIDG